MTRNVLIVSLLIFTIIYFLCLFQSKLLSPSFRKSALNDEDITRLVQKVIRENYGMQENEISQKIHSAVQRVVRGELGPKDENPRAPRDNKSFPQVKKLNDMRQKRILVTGGAGFVGSHLVDKLMMEGHIVIVLDNLFTGKQRNVRQWIGHPHFSLVIHDIITPFLREVDQIYHLACPASPPHYQYNPVKTIKTSTMGTLNMLGLAKRVHATILLASTSEIYGDPEEHPQKESYWGHVNTIGPRACYDEGKRVAETMMHSYHTQSNVDIRIARIFNTFGPRMHLQDGRVVSNFAIEALQGHNITIYGEGEQTRSFQYVSDLVEGLYALMESNVTDPVNLGNPEEYTIMDFAQKIIQLTNSESNIVKLPRTLDDPQRRQPDISRAKDRLGWAPKVDVSTGLAKTIDYFRSELSNLDQVVEPVQPPL